MGTRRAMPPTSKPSSVAVPLLLLVAVLLAAYIPSIAAREARNEHFLKGDCFYYRAVVISLLEDGDLVMNDDIGSVPPLNGQLALGAGGDVERLVPKHPVLMPVASIPFYALFGTRGLLYFNVLMVVSLVAVIFLLNRLFFGLGTSLGVSAAFGIGSLFHEYIFNYSPDIFSTLLFMGGLLLALTGRYAAAGLVLGLSVFAKLPNVLLVGVVGLYLLHRALRPGPELAMSTRERLEPVLRFGGALAVGLLPMAWVNTQLFGAPYVTGYQRAIYADGLLDHVAQFNQPFLGGLWRLLSDVSNGLFPTNPVLFIACLGIPFALRHPATQPMRLLGLLCLTQLAFFAKYDDWAVSHYSNRFLMTTVAIMSVFASAAVQRVVEATPFGRRDPLEEEPVPLHEAGPPEDE